MNTTTATLEARAFIASNDDIDALVTQYMDAHRTSGRCRGSYLKALVATTQAELDIPTRQYRSHRLAPLCDDGKAMQLTALEIVHRRFYARVIARLKLGGLTGELLNKRSGFARTAKSILRTWIRHSNDIAGLAAATVTHADLHVGKHATPAAHRARKVARLVDKRLRSLLIGLGDRETVFDVMDTLAGLQVDLSSDLGLKPTTSVVRSARRHAPLEIKGVIYLPVRRRLEAIAA